jgi:surface antigen
LIGSQFGKGSGKTAMTVAGVLAGALIGGSIARSMEPVDEGCIDQALEHTPNGEPIAWQNPANGASYWVTPTRTEIQPDGTPCRYYTAEAIVQGQREAQTGYACRQPDGTWRNFR